MPFKLVCHETIPGTGFVRGDVIHDQASIDLIKASPEMAKHFGQVDAAAFPDPQPAPAPARPAVKPAE